MSKKLVIVQNQKSQWIGSGIGTPGLSTPMKRNTNRPAHLQPTTDEDLVKTQQKSTTSKANQLTEGILLKVKALFSMA